MRILRSLALFGSVVTWGYSLEPLSPFLPPSERPLEGERHNSFFGTAVVGVGDLDGDGHSDFVVGDHEWVFDEKSTLFLFSGRDKRILWRHETSRPFHSHHLVLSATSDIDGDGVPEILFSKDWDLDWFEERFFGRVTVLSGATGEPIATFMGKKGEWLGYSLAGMEDIDGDGRGDFAMSAPFANVSRGEVRLYSGASGSVLWTQRATEGVWHLGERIAAIGDADGDGVSDIAALGWDGGTFPSAGIVLVYSGSTGALLFRHAFPSHFPPSALAGGDFDQDGYADVACVPLEKQSFWSREVTLVSVRKRAVIRTLQLGDAYFLSYADGAALAVADVDDDGADDVIVGCAKAKGFDGDWETGMVKIFSGQTGKLLWTLEDRQSYSGFGQNVAAAGDIDGDDRDDLLIAASWRDGQAGRHSGAVFVVQSR